MEQSGFRPRLYRISPNVIAIATVVIRGTLNLKNSAHVSTQLNIRTSSLRMLDVQGSK